MKIITTCPYCGTKVLGSRSGFGIHFFNLWPAAVVFGLAIVGVAVIVLASLPRGAS